MAINDDNIQESKIGACDCCGLLFHPCASGLPSDPSELPGDFDLLCPHCYEKISSRDV